MINCTRQFRFEAAHRIFGHKGLCSGVHGHSYSVGVSLRPIVDSEFDYGLDKLGMIIDFAAIKSIIGGWIDESWDHATILYNEDPLSSLWINNDVLQSLKAFHMTSNPTAENMAILLGTEICPELLKLAAVEVTEVTVWETENCCARWAKDV